MQRSVTSPTCAGAVEYDGWYHERDAGQRQTDILRRERLEAEGWRLIVVTAIDVVHPDEVVDRVRRALAARDVAASAPLMTSQWGRGRHVW